MLISHISRQLMILLKRGIVVLVNLTQLVRTMHNICKVWGSNLSHHKKKGYSGRKNNKYI